MCGALKHLFYERNSDGTSRVLTERGGKTVPREYNQVFHMSTGHSVWATTLQQFQTTHHRVVQEATTPLGRLNWTRREHPRAAFRGICSRAELEESTHIQALRDRLTGGVNGDATRSTGSLGETIPNTGRSDSSDNFPQKTDFAVARKSFRSLLTPMQLH